MKNTTTNSALLFCGSRDFLRRVNSAFDRQKKNRLISQSSLVDLRSKLIEERPDIVLLEIGVLCDEDIISMVRPSLEEAKTRGVAIVLVLSTPTKLSYAGDLLFANRESLEASGLIDDFIILPPPGMSNVESLEEQIRSSVNSLENWTSSVNIPTLWSDNWVPSLCSSKSRETWKLWLPRYAAYTKETLLIVGATGTGKTRLATACHSLSERKGPFVSITPRDFSSSELMQAELFGSVAGAFTGAVDRWGLVKKADKGTLFIDELQSIDLELQGKLITFIENREYRRVGDSDRQVADVRFIFATNRSLQDLIREGKLRDDFAYRLERLKIELKPLKDRRLDIAAGATFSLAKILREREFLSSGKEGASQIPVEGFTLEAYRQLMASNWPGNLRQLENAIAKSLEICMLEGSKLITLDALHGAQEGLFGLTSNPASELFKLALEEMKTEIQTTSAVETLTELQAELSSRVRELALESSGGDVTQAAESVGDSEAAMGLYSQRIKEDKS